MSYAFSRTWAFSFWRSMDCASIFTPLSRVAVSALFPLSAIDPRTAIFCHSAVPSPNELLGSGIAELSYPVMPVRSPRLWVLYPVLSTPPMRLLFEVS